VGVPTVAEFLKDPTWSQRCRAARALGDFDDKRAVPMLIEALKDENVNVRVSAVRALGKLGDLSAIAPLKALDVDDGVTTSGLPTTARDAAKEAIRQIQANRPGDAERPWGKAVDGVQVRLRADKLKWEVGETPTFKADFRNKGVHKLHVQPALATDW